MSARSRPAPTAAGPEPDDLRRLPGARRAPLPPAAPVPQLAVRAAAPPAGDDWLHEIKFDGYRTLARIEDGRRVRLYTRNGLDWTRRYGDWLVGALAALPCRQAIVDGEVIVQDAGGRSSFVALQRALACDDPRDLVFYAFDLLYLDGHDLREVPLDRRKAVLATLVGGAKGAWPSPVQLSEHVIGGGPAFLDRACRLGLEGIVSKRRDAPYRPGRSASWIKVKCVESETFALVGYTRSATRPVASLLLAEEDAAGRLRYAGRVAAALPREEARTLLRRLRAIPAEFPPLSPSSAGADGSAVVWVRPVLRAEVEYGGRTADGLLRHARYKGLRLDFDAPASPCRRRSVAPRSSIVPARPCGATTAPITAADLAAIWVTNPDREMFGPGGPTKLDLVLYYVRVADWMLPDLLRRPVSLVRCPTGALAGCFFQRHCAAGMPAAAKPIRLREDASRRLATYFYLENARGLLALAQFGAVEFHPWGCRIDRPEHPDRMILDLDPGEGVRWRDVVAAAFELRQELAALGLAAFVKTTGGKGLHVVVPLRRGPAWPAVQAFSQAVARQLAVRAPRRFTAGLARQERRGRIFIDYLRNVRGATAVAAYSLRARPGAPAALPIEWEELHAIDGPATFTWATALDHIARRARDPWADLGRHARTLTQAMARRLGITGWGGREP